MSRLTKFLLLWEGGATQSQVFTSGQLRGAKVMTISAPSASWADPSISINLEARVTNLTPSIGPDEAPPSFSLVLGPDGTAIDVRLDSASIVDPIPPADEYRLSSSPESVIVSGEFSIAALSGEGVDADVSPEHSPDGIPLRTFSDITTTRRNEAILGNF